jgi:hypothetical protein
MQSIKDTKRGAGSKFVCADCLLEHPIRKLVIRPKESYAQVAVSPSKASERVCVKCSEVRDEICR